MALPKCSPPFLGRRAAFQPSILSMWASASCSCLLPRLCSTQVALSDLPAHHTCRQHVFPLTQKMPPSEMPLHACSLSVVLPCTCVSLPEEDAEPSGTVCAPTRVLILPDNTGGVIPALFAVWCTGSPGSEENFCNERKTLEHFCNQWARPQYFSSALQHSC